MGVDNRGVQGLINFINGKRMELVREVFPEADERVSVDRLIKSQENFIHNREGFFLDSFNKILGEYQDEWKINNV
ncbi:MAG: hypothetical protein LBC92_02570, partial [Rickettsiales bacterium]|nr:hypothetical protein [Rickettsiales bacterium]